jgi:hypothetical protein
MEQYTFHDGPVTPHLDFVWESVEKCWCSLRLLPGGAIPGFDEDS